MTSEFYGMGAAQPAQPYAMPTYPAYHQPVAGTATKPSTEQHLFQCDHHVAEKVKQVKEEAVIICRKHLYRCVRVQTIYGEVFEGTIVNVDKHFLYLQMRPTHDPMRAFGAPFGPFSPYGSSSFILPLVLYELLVISLLI